MTALLLGALVAVAAVVIVALPFLRDSGEPELIDNGPGSDEVLELVEVRDRALAALKELEFDHRTGKVDDADYRAAVGPLRRAVAEALQALDARSGKRPDGEDVAADAGSDGDRGEPAAALERGGAEAEPGSER